MLSPGSRNLAFLAICCLTLGSLALLSDAQLSSCAATPCQNGGTCHPVPASASLYGYRCQCTPEFFGTSCAFKKENPGIITGGASGQLKGVVNFPASSDSSGPVSNAPDVFSSFNRPATVCLNGGTMFSQSCACLPGFSGNRCEFPTDLDECPRNPCKNGGTCKLRPNSMFHCTCNFGFTGLFCDRHSSHNLFAYEDASVKKGLVFMILAAIFILCIYYYYYKKRSSKPFLPRFLTPTPVRPVHTTYVVSQNRPPPPSTVANGGAEPLPDPHVVFQAGVEPPPAYDAVVTIKPPK